MYNEQVDQNHILLNAEAIGDGSSSPVTLSSDEVKIGYNPGKLGLKVRANTAITIVTAKAFRIEVLVGATGAEAVPVAGGHFYPFFKSSADDEKVFAAGDVICDMVIPKSWGPYLKITAYSDEDHTTEKLDAYLYTII